MAEYLEQGGIRFTQTTKGPNPAKFSGQRYEELNATEDNPTFQRLILHPQARGCRTMGPTVDGNYVVFGERPPTQ